MSAAKPCASCGRRTWTATRTCRDCKTALRAYRTDYEHGLHDGRWVLDKRTRVQRWMPAPVVMSRGEWDALKREEAS